MTVDGKGIAFSPSQGYNAIKQSKQGSPFYSCSPLNKVAYCSAMRDFFFARFRVSYRNAPRFICVRSVCTEKSTVHGKGFEKFTSSRYNEIRTCETFTKMRFGERRSFRADMRMTFIRACGVGKRILKTYVGEER